MSVTNQTRPQVLTTPQILSSREEKDTLYFTLANVDTSIANGLRRLILNDVPGAVIPSYPYEKNQIEFLVNTTRHTNEILKQRISSIPIHIKDLTVLDQLMLEVNKQNNGELVDYVTTDDFVVFNKDTQTPLESSEIRRIFPHDPITNDPLLLARLRPKLREDGQGEHLHFRATFAIGSGKDSGMYLQASTCAYGMTVDTDRQAEEWRRESTRMQEEATKHGVPLTEEDLAFEEENWYLGQGKRITIPNHFDFRVKSVGVYSNNELIRMACQSMFDKIEAIERAIQEQTLSIETSQTGLTHGFDVRLEKEDYTFGKVFEYALHEMFYRGRKEKRLSYVGFRKEHPHDDYCLVRVGCVDETEIPTLMNMMRECLDELRKVYAHIHDSV